MDALKTGTSEEGKFTEFSHHQSRVVFGVVEKVPSALHRDEPERWGLRE